MISITVLTDRGDNRGSSFSVDQSWSEFLPSPVDLHFTSLHPGGIRGNHYHRVRKEVIVVLHNDEWTLHWDEGVDTPVESRTFAGAGAVLLTVEPLASHAIVNTGKLDLFTMALTDARFDPQQPDSYPRRLN
ncbi:MAG: hypothetical protein ACKVRP_10235 [Bacteroidota bacterium]